MPKADEPRVAFRISATDFAVLEAAARSVNVSAGALARECAVRYAADVAREVSEGRLKLRRRSAAVPVPSPAAPLPKGVTTGRELLMRERQRKLNERRGS